jgi:hypothetical protein
MPDNPITRFSSPMSYNLQPGSWPWDPREQARRARFRRPARRRLFSRLGERRARSARRSRKDAA